MRRGSSRMNSSYWMGAVLLGAVLVPSLLAPWLSSADPLLIEPFSRFAQPGPEHLFGADALGRDVFSRTLYGGQTSLVVGAVVTLVTVALGATIGATSGFFRPLDAVVMRIMDGLMAIPGLLLAIALAATFGNSLMTVVVAIATPEVPRVVRLVRSLVLSLREELYVMAAVAVATPRPVIIKRHIVPNALPALVVLATYICAAAILTEATLGFLGVGVPPEYPSWGNMIAEARISFQVAPWLILFPSLFLTITVLGVNLLGDGLRDSLDPKLAEKI